MDDPAMIDGAQRNATQCVHAYAGPCAALRVVVGGKVKRTITHGHHLHHYHH